MKTVLIIVAVFCIQISTLMASNGSDVVISSEPTTSTYFHCPKCPALIPEIPMEATFGEITEFNSPLNLVPVIPMEASFCDNVKMTDNSLSPTVPLQADFSDKL